MGGWMDGCYKFYKYNIINIDIQVIPPDYARLGLAKRDNEVPISIRLLLQANSKRKKLDEEMKLFKMFVWN